MPLCYDKTIKAEQFSADKEDELMDEMNQYPTPMQPQGSNGFSIASMVLGIVSIIFACCFWPLSFVTGIVGLVLGILSVKQNRAGKGMAIAGIIMCAVAIVLAIVVVIFVGVAALTNPDWIRYYTSY